MPSFVYFLRNSKNELYVGQTNNLLRREKEQLSKTTKSAKYIKDTQDNFKLIYFEEYSTRLEAMRREKQLKGWTRKKKEALISGKKELLKRL
jgi:putative endonuclease